MKEKMPMKNFIVLEYFEIIQILILYKLYKFYTLQQSNTKLLIAFAKSRHRMWPSYILNLNRKWKECRNNQILKPEIYGLIMIFLPTK